MRSLLASLSLFLAACTVSRGAELTFARVWPEWHDSESFQSLYEDRMGHELASGWIVLRSQPADRSGLYFVTRVENPGGELKGATFVIRVITTESIETKTYSFPSAIPRGSRLFEIGLTGTDWKGARASPVAWEVELDGADGRAIARKTSFLWEKPDR